MCEKCEVKRINRTQKSFYRFTEILLVVLSWISFLFWATCSSPHHDIRKQVSLGCAILCRAFATIVTITNVSLKRKMITYVSLFVDSLLFEVFRPQVRESLLLQDEPYLFGLPVYWQLVAFYQVLTNGYVLQLLQGFEFTQRKVIHFVFNDMDIQSQRTIKCSSPPVALHNEMVIDKFHFETMVTVWFICIILEHFYHTCADYIFWLYIKFEFVIFFGRRQKQPCPYEQNQPHSENPPEQSTPVTRNGLEGNVIKNYKTGPSQRKVEKGFPHYSKKLRKRNLFRTGKLGWSQMRALIPQNIAATENQGKCVTEPSINTQAALEIHVLLKETVVCSTTLERAPETFVIPKVSGVMSFTPEVALATPAPLKAPVVTSTTPEVALATPAPLKAPVVIATTPEVALATPAALKAPVVIATTPEVALATPAALKAPVVIATTPEVALATPPALKAPVVIATTPEVALATPAALKTPVVIATTPEVALATPAISKAALVMSKTSKVGNPTPSQDTHGIPGISRAGLGSEQYEMTARPKGLCVIINNRDFTCPRLGRRDGTDEDVGKLNDFFTRSEFKVTLFENQTDSDILEELKRISSLDHRTYDCFVCFVLSHGQHESVYGTNGGLVSVSELQSFFSARQCRSLAKKPKMFFIQACQGEMVAQGVDAEDVDHGGPLECDVTPMYPVHELADFLTVFATAPGFIAYRNPTSGSPFIGTLIDTLRKYPGRNLLDIITMVTNVMDASVGQKQIPMMKSTLRKHVVLS